MWLIVLQGPRLPGTLPLYGLHRQGLLQEGGDDQALQGMFKHSTILFSSQAAILDVTVGSVHIEQKCLAFSTLFFSHFLYLLKLIKLISNFVEVNDCFTYVLVVKLHIVDQSFNVIA